MKLRENIEYAAVAALLGLCRILPEAMVYATFQGLGRLSHALMASRRKIALRNTEIAFPEKDLPERRQIVQRHFLNLAESLALNTMVMSGRISDDRLMGMVETEGWENLEQAIRESNKGVLAFSAHIGNWEMMLQYAALRLENPLYVIARKSNNMLLEERIVKPLREHYGVNVFYKKNAILKTVKAIGKGGIAGMMVDQKLNLAKGVPVEFFGREAGTSATPALLQIRFGIATVPMFMIKTARWKYRFIIGAPIEWTDNGKPMEEQALALTRIHQKTVEDIIREYPDQWFWVHNRWGLKKGER